MEWFSKKPSARTKRRFRQDRSRAAVAPAVGSTGVPQIADDPSRRPRRQPWADKRHSRLCSAKRCNVQLAGAPFEDRENHRCRDANLLPQSAWWRPALSLNPIRSRRNLSVPLRIAPSSQMGFISISPNRAMDRESDSGRSTSYATLRCALRAQTTPTVRLFAADGRDARHCSMSAGTRSYAHVCEYREGMTA
jgi:hypothetical protein